MGILSKSYYQKIPGTDPHNPRHGWLNMQPRHPAASTYNFTVWSNWDTTTDLYWEEEKPGLNEWWIWSALNTHRSRIKEHLLHTYYVTMNSDTIFCNLQRMAQEFHGRHSPALRWTTFQPIKRRTNMGWRLVISGASDWNVEIVMWLKCKRVIGRHIWFRRMLIGTPDY